MKKNEIDVAGFKKGLAALMENYYIASLRTWGPKTSALGMEMVQEGVDITGLMMLGAHPGKLLLDIVEPKVNKKAKFARDIVGLFNYYRVQAIYKGADHFFIGFDDGGVFKFENVIIKGADEDAAHYSF